MATFPFELVSPTRLVFSGEVEQVDVPGAEGDFGVLAGHAPFISALRPGVLTIRGGSNIARFFVRGGFAEVNPAGLTVLAESAVPVEEVGQDVLVQEIRAAEKALAEAKDEAERWKLTEAAEQLKAAAAQIGQASSSTSH
jgi:F-type H+-transporting ATPase subunit epsilon